MTIESELKRIADALEALAGSPSTTKPAKSQKSSGSKSAPKASSKKASSDAPSKDDVRAALKKLQGAKDAQAARDMLKAHGAKTLTDLDEDKYADLIAGVEEALDE